MKEYKVGERFYHDGVLIEVVKDNKPSSCDCKELGCCFPDTDICSELECDGIYYEKVKQDCNCANYKPKRTETRVKQPEALLKALLDGGWKPRVDKVGCLYFEHNTEIDFNYDIWKHCGKKSDIIGYTWHPSWLEEVEV